MLPSTKIFIGMSMIVTGGLLGFVVPIWMPMPTPNISKHGEMVDGMLEQMHFINAAYLVSLFLCLAGLVVLFFGLHGTARLVEKIYFNSRPATPPHSEP